MNSDDTTVDPADRDHSDTVESLTARSYAPLADVPTDLVDVVPLSGPVDVTIRPPGSKSITNRALICAALSDSPTELRGVLLADDTIAMVRCLIALGIEVEAGATDDILTITPGHLSGQPTHPIRLDADLSGTTARFIMPVAALLAGHIELDGREPLRRRPMSDLVAAMTDLGARIRATQPGDRLPLTVDGTGLRGGDVEVRGDVSSQFLSALLMVGPALDGGLRIRLTTPLVSRPYVAMTLSVMESFGATVEWRGDELSVGGTYRSSGVYNVEPDASAASYFLATAALSGGSTVIEGLGSESMQGDIRLADVLGDMGMDVEWDRDRVRVTSTGVLHGVTVDMSDISDVAQTLAVVATAADSPTRVSGIGFIRAKETDRIGAVVTELRRLGIDAVEEPDGFVVTPGSPVRGIVRTYDDHRMAMSFAVLGLAHPGITIADPHCVAKTYPGFWQDLGRI